MEQKTTNSLGVHEESCAVFWRCPNKLYMSLRAGYISTKMFLCSGMSSTNQNIFSHRSTNHRRLNWGDSPVSFSDLYKKHFYSLQCGVAFFLQSRENVFAPIYMWHRRAIRKFLALRIISVPCSMSVAGKSSSSNGGSAIASREKNRIRLKIYWKLIDN